MGANGPRKSPGRPSKPDSERMDKDLNVRVSQAQRDLFEKAAARARERRGSGTYSDWVREALTQAARKELGQKGKG